MLPYLALIEDWQLLATARKNPTSRFRRRRAVTAFLATKAIFLAYALAFPLLALDITVGQLLLGFLTATATALLLFVMVNIRPHILEHAAFISPDETRTIEHDWATHQAMTAINWVPYSRWASFLTGGANARTAHHIFPDAAHSHNRAVTRLVRKSARKFVLPHNVTSFWGMLAVHGCLLVKLSTPPLKPK